MYLPIQSEPVQRTIVGQSAVLRGGTVASGHGIVPSQSGVEASGIFDVFNDIVRGAGTIATTAGPLLGALGI